MRNGRNLIDRREFLGQASCAGLGYLTFINTFFNLKAINAATISNSSVADTFNDYKAVVCILLAGGNDSFNMLVPYDTASHAEYVTARSGLYTNSNGLAIPRSELAGTVLNYTQGSKEWAMHASMQRVRDLFNNNRLALLANTGTLVQPTTKTDYQNNSNLPLGLFSHADQIQQWQTGIPNERSAKGWAGKMADLIGDNNGNQKISMNVSLSGSNIWQTGDVSIEYAIDPYYGPIGIEGYNPDASWMVEVLRTQALDSLIGHQYQDIFKKTYITSLKNARDGFIEFESALENSIVFADTDFPDSYLGASLEMIARVIDIRDILDFKRQVFFIVVGGWDHHDEVINNQLGMLGMVSEALGSFQDALGPSGVNVEDQVLTMLISEFGRTLTSNGNGSDHAWGGNTIVMGGPNLINGGALYGEYPSLILGPSNPIELGLGRFIPQLSTDEYFAEVAKWFGVPNSDLSILFPNLGNFYDPFSQNYPVGFIKS